MTPDAFVVNANPKKPAAEALAQEIEAWCQREGFGFLLLKEDEAPEQLPGNHPIGLSLGGDGTLLHASRLLTPRNAPLLGVNLGALGFLSPLNADEIWEALEQVKQGQYSIENRMCLGTTLNDKTHTVLNEFSVLHASPDSFTEVEVYRGNEFIGSYPGDGIILSTPTGSTAYSLAAGGPVLTPELEVILVTPLNPHKLGLRPLVMPADCCLTVKINGKASIIGDGKVLQVATPGTCFEVGVSPMTAQLIRLDSVPDWFTLLEEKLHWQRRSPEKELES